MGGNGRGWRGENGDNMEGEGFVAMGGTLPCGTEIGAMFAGRRMAMGVNERSGEGWMSLNVQAAAKQGVIGLKVKSPKGKKCKFGLVGLKACRGLSMGVWANGINKVHKKAELTSSSDP